MKGETLEDATKRLINNEVFCCQSSLVEELFSKDIFICDDVRNNYSVCKDRDDELCSGCRDHNGCDNMEMKEVFEWYAVSTWLGEELAKRGAVVLDNYYGVWYGRECTGQSMYMDNDVLKAIAKEIYL